MKKTIINAFEGLVSFLRSLDFSPRFKNKGLWSFIPIVILLFLPLSANAQTDSFYAKVVSASKVWQFVDQGDTMAIYQKVLPVQHPGVTYNTALLICAYFPDSKVVTITRLCQATVNGRTDSTYMINLKIGPSGQIGKSFASVARRNGSGPSDFDIKNIELSPEEADIFKEWASSLLL